MLKRAILNEDQNNKNDLLMNYYKRLKLNNNNNNNNSLIQDDSNGFGNSDNEFIELNKSNFEYFNDNNENNNNSNSKINYFYFLSIELLIKIFNYCDPFYTPLIFICKDWYYIINDNQVSLWKDLQISINSNNKPILYQPNKNAILSYFKCGFYKSLNRFSINSIDFKPIKNSNSSGSGNNSSNNSPNRKRQQPTQFKNNNNYPQKQLFQSEPINNINNNNNNNNIPIDYKFLKEIINIICNNNLNLKKIDIILPINHKQLRSIVSQCKYLKDLSFNGLFIDDDELKDIFSQPKPNDLQRLKNVSIMVVGQFSEEFKQKKKKSISGSGTGAKHSSLTPSSLHSLSKMNQLKSLKFSLLPHYGNFKSIVEQHNDTIPMQQIPNSTSSSNIVQDESEWCTASLGYLDKLENLEVSSCVLSGSVLSDLLTNGFNSLTSLVLYRIGSLSSLKFVSHSLKTIQLSCLSILEYIEITCSILDSFSIEGCEALQSTLIYAPNMQSLSFESCSGRLNLLQADSLQVLSLFECQDLTQSSLEQLLDSLPVLEELYIYLQQIKNLRIASISLRKLDFEAWSGILSCVLDCPSLEELNASESTIETLYLKATNVCNIELDFCDSLRTIIIDVLSCYHFSFTQNHPFKGFTNLPDLNENHYRTPMIDNDGDENEQELDEENRINRSYFLSTNLFLQSQNFIQNCIILSSNIIGSLSTRVLGSLSIEERSKQTFSYNVPKICKYNIYKEVTNCIGKSPKFVSISQQHLIHYPQQQQQQPFEVYDFTPSPPLNFKYNNCNQSKKNTFDIYNYYKNDNISDKNIFEFLDEYGGNSNYLFNGFKKI